MLQDGPDGDEERRPSIGMEKWQAAIFKVGPPLWDREGAGDGAVGAALVICSGSVWPDVMVGTAGDGAVGAVLVTCSGSVWPDVIVGSVSPDIVMRWNVWCTGHRDMPGVAVRFTTVSGFEVYRAIHRYSWLAGYICQVRLGVSRDTKQTAVAQCRVREPAVSAGHAVSAILRRRPSSPCGRAGRWETTCGRTCWRCR